MRYLHLEIDELLRYLEEQKLVLTEMGISEPWTSSIGVETLRKYTAATDVLWGERPRSFIVADDEALAHMTMRDAVQASETTERPKCLLIGYNDGGLISVSRETLPFQQGAAQANWWEVW